MGQRPWMSGGRVVRWAASLVLAGLATQARGACVEGTTGGTCTLNGCPGQYVCTGGRFVCEADPDCNAGLPDELVVKDGRPGRAVGALIDGSSPSGAWVDQRRSGQGSTATFPLELAALSPLDEAVAFGLERTPAIESTPWSGGVDRFVLRLSPATNVPVTVWIVAGPFHQELADAASALVGAMAALRSERTGIGLSPVEFRDATAHSGQLSFTHFWNLVRTVGEEPGRINVYWLGLVDGGTGNGLAIPGYVAVGHDTGAPVLAHEFGHEFSLEHVGPPKFDADALMQPFVGNVYLSEGQVFRMQFDPGSAVNRFGSPAPAGKPTRTCLSAQHDPLCPALHKRIWRDGRLPAN